MIQFALLKGVNVGGHRPVPMAGLREWAESLGFVRAQTLLQSGNLILEGGKWAGAALEAHLEKKARSDLKLETLFVVRSAPEWAALLAANPFTTEAKSDPGRLLILALKSAPTPAAIAALQEAIPGRERAAVKGKNAYLYYPDGAGASRFTSALIERRLGVAGTARNWNTAQKLAALAHTAA